MRISVWIAMVIGMMWACEKPAVVRKKAVFIILDGIPADVIERISTPTLDAIAGASGYSRAYVGGIAGTYQESPTISAPGYMSLLTGTWSYKHQVWGNYNLRPDYDYYNVFRMATSIDSNLTTAIFSTWTDNRTVLVGEGAKNAGDFRIDYAFDGFELDTLGFPHDEASNYIRSIDSLVATAAGRAIAETAPDLSWVYLQYTDDIGHAFGDSEVMDAAVRQADSLVSKIWTGVQARMALGEDWLVVVTTDHGRDSLTGRNHGGQSERERQTWIVTNARELNERFLSGTPAVVDVLPVLMRHLHMTIPEGVQREIDGIPFTGPVSFDGLSASLDGDTLTVQWKAQDQSGEGGLFAAFGAKSQDYVLLENISLEKNHTKILLTAAQRQTLATTGVLKLWLKGPYNSDNYWIFKE